MIVSGINYSKTRQCSPYEPINFESSREPSIVLYEALLNIPNTVKTLLVGLGKLITYNMAKTYRILKRFISKMETFVPDCNLSLQMLKLMKVVLQLDYYLFKLHFLCFAPYSMTQNLTLFYISMCNPTYNPNKLL